MKALGVDGNFPVDQAPEGSDSRDLLLQHYQEAGKQLIIPSKIYCCRITLTLTYP